MKPLLFWVLILLAGCGGDSNPQGQVIPNGGDPRRLLMDRGRDHLASVLERLPLDDGTAKKWIATSRSQLIRNLREKDRIVYEWNLELPPDCPPGTCACTRYASNVTYFSYRSCGDAREWTKENAAKLALVEEHHRLVETLPGGEHAEQALADSLATWVFERWRALGHPDTPHWLPMASADFEGIPLFRRGRLELLGEDRRGVYDATRDLWTTVKLENNYLEFTPFRKMTNDWNRRKNVTSPLMAGNPADRVILFAECHTQRLKQGTGFILDEAQRRWRSLPSIPNFRARREGYYSTEGNLFLVWGGYACDTEQPLFDGAIYDGVTGKWTRIPAAPLEVASGSREGVTATSSSRSLFVWGGESRILPRDEQLFTNRETRNGQIYDFAKGQWEAIAPAPPGFSASRFAAASTLSNNRFLVYDSRDQKALSYSSEMKTWAETLLPPKYAAPSATESSSLYAFSNGTHILFLPGGTGWMGSSVAIFDGELGQWAGPILSPVMMGGGSFFDIPDPDLPFYRAPRRSAFWAGMEWVIYEHPGYRFFP